jgi:hypothetical protein
MNRKNLTAAVLAGLAGAAGIVGSAQAVNINPDGLGQVLVYPYYTVNGGNMTLLSVVNTSEDGKAVKVRFLEGKNSREVLDFNLYMSPYDVWTASLKKKLDGTPRLKTTDTTCTVPYIYDFALDGHDPAQGDGVQEFLRFGMDDLDGFVEDDLDTYGDISRATEGHFEMIEMGTLFDDPGMEGAWPAVPVETAATHVNGMPAACDALVGAWTDPDDIVPDDEGPWLRYGPFIGVDDPSGGLFGGAAIVNVQNGTMYSYDAKAIDGFADEQIHEEPGTTKPGLNDGNIYEGIVFVDGMIRSWDFDDGNGGRTVDAVSYVFMHDSVMNEYTTESGIAGATEWVMTFPTKHFYVYGPDSGDFSDPVDPFTSTWDREYAEACEVVRLATIWDREEKMPGLPDEPSGNPIPPIVSPAPPPPPGTELDPIIPFELCYETSVIAFGEMGGGILGSDNLHTIDNATELFTSEFGWARLDMYEYSYDEDEDGILDCENMGTDEDPDWVGDECLYRDPLGNLAGLPVTGFAVQEFANAYLGDGGDVLANYGGIFQHKYTRMYGMRMVD